MSSFLKTIMAGVCLMSLSGAGLAEGDPVKGEKVFRKCKACHSMEPGKKMMGPSLAGVMGRRAGTLEGFKFSPAMVKSGIVWDDETMAGYLKAPRTYIKGNRMMFIGLRKPQEIEDILAYLKEAGK